MVRPGVEVVTGSVPPSRGAPSDTGVAFLAGITEKGPSDKETKLNNIGDYGKVYGARAGGVLAFDAVDLAFRKGAREVHFGRTVGPDATFDQVTLDDAGGLDSLTVRTIGQGASNLTVSVAAGGVGGTYVLVVTDTGLGREVERSYDLTTAADAVAWSQTAKSVRVTAVGANPPAVVGATALAGGDDDRAGVTDAERAATLALFPKGLGPGQVAYPGATTTAMHAALLNHAKTNNRFALLDGQDTPSDTTLTAEADGDRAAADLDDLAETHGMLLAPWHVVRGVVGGTTRTVPPSAIAAGLIASSDARTDNPNVAAAANNGDSSDVTLALSQPAWDDDTREALNAAGVNLFREVPGGAFQLYGFRTLADPANPESAAWKSAGAARTRMAVQNELEIYASQFVFNQIDGQGQTIARFRGGLIGILQKWWAKGALFGLTPAEAFLVDTGATVNTPDTLEADELHAAVGLRISPFAELVYIEVSKVPSNQTL